MKPLSASNKPERLADFTAAAIAQLKSAGIDNPGLDARLLIAHALKLDRAQLLSRSERLLNDSEQGAIEALLARRARHEPVARILGSREFWSLPFGLNEATLEPRPDSETLIEAVLKNVPKRDARLHLLDLGTGTSCLLLALLHELSNAMGLGIDTAARAVQQAAVNAEALGLEKRARFQAGNWLEGIDGRFDIIISNPPYIPRRDIAKLMPEVRDYDPESALDGGMDGLDAYRHLIPQLPRFLKSGGLAAFEIGQGQASDVAALFYDNGFTKITTRKDLGGIERCITAVKPDG